MIERILIKNNRKKEKDNDASTHMDAGYSEGAKENVPLEILFLMFLGLFIMSHVLGSASL